MTSRPFFFLAVVAFFLAFCVVILGAYVRLSDAGLGCPDWPGCYGYLDVPVEDHHVQVANAAYPERPVEVDKAWKEMIHRYLAGLLGLLVLTMAITAWRNRRQPGQPLLLPLSLLGLIIFQSLLGMWTVTLQLKPVIVMGHLLGGFATLSLLWLLVVRQTSWRLATSDRALWPWTLLGLAVVIMQVGLGGWTSANYAALACPDFPTCQTAWWPKMDFNDGFILWRGIGINYEFGVLDNDARVAIHMAHRIGAVITLMYLLALCGFLWFRAAATTQLFAGVVLIVLIAQITLGIGNIVWTLPLPVAVAHNGVAALLVLSLVTLNYLLLRRNTP